MSSHLFLISWAGNNNGGALVLEPVYVVEPLAQPERLREGAVQTHSI